VVGSEIQDLETSGGSGPRWFDNHCHLTSIAALGAKSGADAPLDAVDVVAAAASVGVDYLLTVGCTVPDSVAAAEVASQFGNVWSTAGVHPHDAEGGTAGLAELMTGETVRAVGECGLDYYYDNSPRDAQRSVFVEHIELAHEHHLPLVIHSRDAWDDTFEILAAEGTPERLVFHCFTGGPKELERGLEIGAMFSFSGILTYPSAKDLQAAAKLAPLERVMVETDSPYLAPVPVRGKATSNRPANVRYVGEFLANLTGRSVEDVAEATTANALSFYDIKRS